MPDASTFAKIRIGIASPEDIRSWSHGEVTKPETINYRTFKPERDGLFCERIFGPVKDWECHCGRYKKIKFKGVRCERCGVEVIQSKVRRERMGHIELAVSVCHIWYLKGTSPSPLALMLNIAPRLLEQVLYYASYIMTDIDTAMLDAHKERIHQALQEEAEELAWEREEGKGKREKSVREETAEVAGEWEESFEEGDENREPPLAEEGEEAFRQEERYLEERLAELKQARLLFEQVCEKKLAVGQAITEDQARALEYGQAVLARRLGTAYAELVRTETGGAAIKGLLQKIDLQALALTLRKEMENTQGGKRERLIRRLEIVESFIASKARPEWMILDAVPVISPELRPMVRLDGGRFATSDLNDLYRRIINRNNRLKKITEIRAPGSIVNHEKRLLQEAVDALIDNGRRTRPVVGSNNRALKSLSDMLKGKEGRFRKNLLGKRVDYSGRSVIVVGPHLKLHQCGLPKEMALELFKPFVMRRLQEPRPDRPAYTDNTKTAKRMIERRRPEVWDALEEVIREHPVLLNRAPTLHRLGIQAFEPVLVDGKAIQVHPLVCHAFNADFDGDQMAVHVPLSAYAQAEARILMLSSHNLFSPANGDPIVAPTKDMILGLYYLTALPEPRVPRDYIFSSPEEAILAHDCGQITLQEPIRVRIPRDGRGLIVGDSAEARQQTTVGRLLLNQILPETLRYADKYLYTSLTGPRIADLCADIFAHAGKDRAIAFLDDLKALGFRYATASGVTISLTDLGIPSGRDEILRQTEEAVTRTNRSFQRGLISEAERKSHVLDYWRTATDRVAETLMEGIDPASPLYMMIGSGARGSKRQLAQLSGTRGLMTDPFGNLIEDLPIKSNFHEGLNVLEFFVSTHGARKGMADIALRTADAGFLTRRLVDVSHEVIVRAEDCGTTNGIAVTEMAEGEDLRESLAERVRGRYAALPLLHPVTQAVLVAANTEIDDSAARLLDAFRIVCDDLYAAGKEKEAPLKRQGDLLTAAEVEALLADGVHLAGRTLPARSREEITTSLTVPVRSVLTCALRHGVCAHCYGRDLATGNPAEVGTAVGIIAAQSIGEPGTQLTMRNFQSGGIAGDYLTGVVDAQGRQDTALRQLLEDIRRGLIHVGGSERERTRTIQALLKVLEPQLHGLLRVVELFEARPPKGEAIIAEQGGTVVAVERKERPHVALHVPVLLGDTAARFVGEKAGEDVVDAEGAVIVRAGETITEALYRSLKRARIEQVTLRKTVLVPYRGDLRVRVGDRIRPGDRLTDGPLNLEKVLALAGSERLYDYLVREVQNVYKGQGVDIHDKHIEVIVRQMLRRCKIRQPGGTRFLPGQIVDRYVFEDENARVCQLDPLGLSAMADPVLQGISEAALTTESFLSAASFQRTTRILTEAAIRGKKDRLTGLKENVILGRLIPAGTGLAQYCQVEPAASDGTPLETAREEQPQDPCLSDDDPEWDPEGPGTRERRGEARRFASFATQDGLEDLMSALVANLEEDYPWTFQGMDEE